MNVTLLDGTKEEWDAEAARKAFHKGELDWDYNNNCYAQPKKKQPKPKGTTFRQYPRNVR